MRKTLCALALVALTLPACAAEVWFAPNDNLPRGAAHDVILNDDFPKLFDAHPGWTAQTDVFNISPMLSGPAGAEDELRRIGVFLKTHGVKLSIGAHVMLLDNVKPVEGECGVGVEGMRRPKQNEAIFQRLKRIGLAPDYVQLDEPLTFGHYFHGKAACRYDIADVARRTAEGVAEIRKAFPEVRIVDDEAPQPGPTAQFRADFEAWLKAYREAAGAPFDAVIFDVDLFGDWREKVAAGVEICKRRGVRAGIFVIKPGPGVSDAQAVASYTRAMAEIDASKIAFDIVEVANWTKHPFHNLPPSDPTTLTYVLDRYTRTHGRK